MNITGNFNPFLQTAAAVGQSGGDGMAFYTQIGQQILERQMAQMQMQQQQSRVVAGQQAESAPAQSMGTQGSLTSGFDADWLNKRLSAGSANGAGI